MNHKIHEVYQNSLADLLAKWQQRRSRALSPDLPDLVDAALMLLNLNLDPLAELLDSLYSDNSRGRPRYDPTAMLRGLLLMTMLHPFLQPIAECSAISNMGPIVYIRSDQDPRFYPPIPRDSARFKQIMNPRSGCERSNSTKKTVHHPGDRPCRSATHYLFRLHLVSIVEHAKAWVAEDRKLVGDDLVKLCELAIKQYAKT